MSATSKQTSVLIALCQCYEEGLETTNDLTGRQPLGHRFGILYTYGEHSIRGAANRFARSMQSGLSADGPCLAYTVIFEMMTNLCEVRGKMTETTEYER